MLLSYVNSSEETRYVLKCGGFTSPGGMDFVTWLENDLKKANESRSERPWIIVAGHHPMYCISGYNQNMADAIEDLLYKYEVDLMLTGHVHDYEVSSCFIHMVPIHFKTSLSLSLLRFLL
jgi:hypothetical protein